MAEKPVEWLIEAEKSAEEEKRLLEEAVKQKKLPMPERKVVILDKFVRR